MKPEERLKQFDLAWELIKQNDFQKQGKATQTIFNLLYLHDENACGLVGRLIILKIYWQHPERERLLNYFYSPIYDPWINSRNAQASLATYTLKDALTYLVIAAKKNLLLISPLKVLAAFIKDDPHYNHSIDQDLNAIDQMPLPKHSPAPTLFAPPPAPPKNPPFRILREERKQCVCTLL